MLKKVGTKFQFLVYNSFEVQILKKKKKKTVLVSCLGGTIKGSLYHYAITADYNVTTAFTESIWHILPL